MNRIGILFILHKTMTLSEKKQLQNLLITAQTWISGYKTNFIEKLTIPVLIINCAAPLFGESSALFEKMLTAISLSAEKDYRVMGIPVSDNDIMRTRLETHLEKIQPDIILLLGKSFVRSFSTSDISTFCGIPLMAIHHPEELLRDSSLKRAVWEDLKVFKARLDSFRVQ